ncbi:MAG: dihydrofolate reductase [Bacteroidales bacterium]|nr:dihydrofolate reductase [Bacteroidales bacterium]
MRNLKIMAIASCFCMLAASCGDKAQQGDFKYCLESFADLEVIRYQIPGWESLSFQDKEYAYYLAEAAKYGRDIIWAQNFECGLPIRKALETIIKNYPGERSGQQWEQFLSYAKRVFFSNGIHHHYGEHKFFPECERSYMESLFAECGVEDGGLIEVIYNPDIAPWRKYQGTDKDMIAASANHLYEGVTQAEAEKFYADMEDPFDPRPISYGLNSRLIKDTDGKLEELVYKTDGLYGEALTKICENLNKAAEVAPSDRQKQIITDLVDYFTTGDLRTWDKYNIEWAEDTVSKVDFINGFIEVYGDPLGLKGNFEAMVNFKDEEASRRTEVISAAAQWFEDNSPIDPRFRKAEVKGVSAKVINAVVIAGDTYPATAIGINLPNADWIRKEHGSKSVTIANITEAYDKASLEKENSVLGEFAWDDAEKARAKKYGYITDNLHTDLHECLGHGSGQLLEGTNPNALKEYSSTLEEARADLFALYYLADPKLVELGLLNDPEAYKAEYDSYIRNGIFTQFTRIELGKQNTEAHMQNRKLIADWCFEKGAAANVIEMKKRDGKTYFVINDYDALRELFAELLAEIQRIKSEGDYTAGRELVEKYAVNIDPYLHREVLERYAALDLKPYRGFVNPTIVPVVKRGKTVDYKLEYCDDFLSQQLEYGEKYATL